MKSLVSFLISFCLSGMASGSTSPLNSPDRGRITVGFLDRHSLTFDIASVDDYETVFVIKQTAQSLLDENEYGSIIPSIAKAWTVSSDMKVYTFYLREDMHFHDGNPVTASEVEKSINVVRSSNMNPANYYLRRIESIRVLNPLKLEITLAAPWFGFLHCLSSGLVPIFSSEAYNKKGKSFVGSGPYKLVLQDGVWIFRKYNEYRGPYQSYEDEFRVLTTAETSIEPDVLIRDLSHYPDFKWYKKSEVDSFVAFNFMINPARQEWKDKSQRLLLIKMLLHTRKIISSPRLKDLRDIFPRGMLGYDVKGEAFERLMRDLTILDPGKLLKKRIVIGSLNPIMNFDILARTWAKEYGVTAINFVTQSPNYLEKLYRNKDIDVFTVGWGSIFNHPDATFVPFYILGLKNANSLIERIIEQIPEATTLASQFELYRYLSSVAISEGYILPHSQVSAGTYFKPTVEVPGYRYRYTLQLSEVRRLEDRR